MVINPHQCERFPAARSPLHFAGPLNVQRGACVLRAEDTMEDQKLLGEVALVT
jgi:hypothetical protein